MKIRPTTCVELSKNSTEKHYIRSVRIIFPRNTVYSAQPLLQLCSITHKSSRIKLDTMYLAAVIYSVIYRLCGINI